jgi:hypothetical protein
MIRDVRCSACTREGRTNGGAARRFCAELFLNFTCYGVSMESRLVPLKRLRGEKKASQEKKKAGLCLWFRHLTRPQKKWSSEKEKNPGTYDCSVSH